MNRRHRFMFERPGSGHVASPPPPPGLAVTYGAGGGSGSPVTPPSNGTSGILVVNLFAPSGSGVVTPVGWTLYASQPETGSSNELFTFWIAANNQTTVNFDPTGSSLWFCYWLPTHTGPDGHLGQTALTAGPLPLAGGSTGGGSSDTILWFFGSSTSSTYINNAAPPSGYNWAAVLGTATISNGSFFTSTLTGTTVPAVSPTQTLPGSYAAHWSAWL